MARYRSVRPRGLRKSWPRRGGRKGLLGGLGVSVSPSFLGGIVLGFTNLDDKLPQELVLATAVAPIRGIGVVKGAAQGIVVGNLIQKLTGGKSIGARATGWGL